MFPNIGSIISPMAPRTYCKAWTNLEDASIIGNYSKWGPSWALISRQLKGRSPVECRRRWLVRAVLPAFQQLAIKEPPMGPEDAKRKIEISKIVSKAHAVGLRQSPAFALQTPTKPLAKAQLAEWEARMKGFEPITNSKWVQFPEETRIHLPYENLSFLLPRHIPRWRIIRRGWSPLEDAVLREAYEHHGSDWIEIHYALPKRTWQECRRRLSMLSLRWNPISTIENP